MKSSYIYRIVELLTKATRELREEQDLAYLESLRVDRAKVGGVV